MRASVLLILALTAPVYRPSDTTTLVCDREHPSDSMAVAAEDPGLVYEVAWLEASSLSPFCIALAATAPNATPQQLWGACFAGGHIAQPVDVHTQGGPNRAVAVIVTSPIRANPERVVVLSRLVLLGHVVKPASPKKAGEESRP